VTSVDIRVLPPAARDRALAYLARTPDPSEPRDSASVLLVREATGGPEVCTILRHHAMATAGGVLVFPGGLVDLQDVAQDVSWVAGDPQAWSADLGVGVGDARAVVTAAVRELFEETGVLLAGPTAHEVAVQPLDGWREQRSRLEAHELTFAEFLSHHGWGVRGDLLHLWSTWLTPEFESRRYRARFFIAELPEGQTGHDGSSESTELRWDTPVDLLDGARRGAHQLLAPQYCLSLEMEDLGDVAALVAATASRPRPVVAPTLEMVDAVPRLGLPPELVALAQLD
jgi:8-oxo-dGTP pyrophosphatase MutT (NUDIX family)